jgi:hypothetical protein
VLFGSIGLPPSQDLTISLAELFLHSATFRLLVDVMAWPDPFLMVYSPVIFKCLFPLPVLSLIPVTTCIGGLHLAIPDNLCIYSAPLPSQKK